MAVGARTSTGSRLPSLGPRGEGWVVGQLVLIALIGVLGLRERRDGPRRIHGLFALAGWASLFTAVVVAVLGARDLGANLTPMPRPRRDADLVVTGTYSLIRHPLYAAVMLGAIGWGAAMRSVRSLLAAGVLVLWLHAKARREEAWLVGQFPGYAAYRDRTRRFIPGLY